MDFVIYVGEMGEGEREEVEEEDVAVRSRPVSRDVTESLPRHLNLEPLQLLPSI